MQTSGVASTVRVGNHALTAAEAAAGVAGREAFVDEAGAPADPDAVRLALTAPTGETRTFGWPEAGPTDAGALEQQETGRFFVDWTPADGEGGLWRWALLGGMSLRTRPGEAWWLGFTTAHGQPSWATERRFAFRVEGGAVVRTRAGAAG